MKFFISLFLGVGLASAIPQPLPGVWSNREPRMHELSKRTSPLLDDSLMARSLPMCSHDNLFRIFLDTRYSSSASAFCSTYITLTSVSTVFPLTTKTVTAMTTDATAFSTVIVLATATSTIDAKITATPKAKRQALVGAPGKAGTYPPSRISSACSCLVTPAVIISTTTTASASTVTAASLLHITRVATTVQTSTTTVDFTALSTITASSSPASAPAAYCSASSFGFATGQSTVFLTTQCSTSYHTAGANIEMTVTATSYLDCAAQCTMDLNCSAFSYFRTVPSNNCQFYNNPTDSISDPAVDSGTFS